MKLVFTLSLVTMMSAPAFADPDPALQYQALRKAANEQCRLPEKLHPVSDRMYTRFLAQTLVPEAKMLNTAFVTGFSAHMSKYQPLANCLVVFLGRPNDPNWERGFSFYQRAKAADALPEMMFTGFSEEDGSVALSPTPEGGVN